MSYFILAMLWAGMLSVLPAQAKNDVLSPDEIPGTTKVDAEGLLDLVEKVPRLIIVDARIRQDRLQGYIEGSIGLPDVETNCETLANVAPRKSSPVVFYCNGPKCGRSVKSAFKALDCGYTRIYWFRGGFEEWTKKKYPYLKK